MSRSREGAWSLDSVLGRAALRRGWWQGRPLTVAEAMCPRALTLAPDTPARALAAALLQHSAVLIVDGERRLLGLVRARDLVRAAGEARDLAPLSAGDLMMSPGDGVAPEERVLAAVTRLDPYERGGAALVPVIDSSRRVLGALSLEEIAALAEQDDELRAALEALCRSGIKSAKGNSRPENVT